MKELIVSEKIFEKIEKLIKQNPELGYMDVDDFIRDALRHFLLKYQENCISTADHVQQH